MADGPIDSPAGKDGEATFLMLSAAVDDMIVDLLRQPLETSTMRATCAVCTFSSVEISTISHWGRHEIRAVSNRLLLR
jgi:hypothetical protein